MRKLKAPDVVVIDGDPFVYQIGFSCSRHMEIDGDVVSNLNIDEAKSMIDVLIRESVSYCGAHDYVVALSDLLANWRKTLDTSYKAHRKAGQRPGGFGQMRAHLSAKHKAVQWPRCEGDDVCGVIATEHAAKGKRVAIVSIDKDLRTIPGWHFNPQKKEDGLVHVTPEQAWRNHFKQTLTGDTTDGYPGCPGVGPVKAGKILDSCVTPYAAWGEIVKMFESKGLGEADALLQARLARILQMGDYNRKTGEIKLWNPPTRK